MPALIIHLIPSVREHVCLLLIIDKSLHQVLVIIFPPPKVVYPFILNVEGYPTQIIHFFIIVVNSSRLMRPALFLTCYPGPFLSALYKAPYSAAIQRWRNPPCSVGFMLTKC